MESKIQFCDSMKQNYASQLVKTNDIRTSYYYDKLPSVINKLQDLEKNRIELIKTGILGCIAKEREVSTKYIMQGVSTSVGTSFIQFTGSFISFPPLLNFSITEIKFLF